MLQGLFSKSDTPHEGDEYKTITEGGKTFVIHTDIMKIARDLILRSIRCRSTPISPKIPYTLIRASLSSR